MDGEEVDKSEVGRIRRTRMMREDVWMEKGLADEEREVCPMDQHQHEGQGDETQAETRSKGWYLLR